MKHVVTLCAGLSWVLLMPPALAQHAVGGEVPRASSAVEPELPASAIGQLPSDGRAMPMSDADLAGNRGGQTKVVGNQTLTSVTKGNVLNGNYAAGSVTLSDKALSNFNGVGNIVINTGAQVSLQSGMNLTINVAP